ncbi:hypothetical protein BDFB_008409 [Asbolus verrucosus]|uniref:Uncharacterized protein n=1 Tax=Asbolus verrucosus TaxID=1661398 RepID=A0A482WCG0_ASBVE|nr:hypothetical protein BDFB_008409 [Asbolus verrucosus]
MLTISLPISFLITYLLLSVQSVPIEPANNEIAKKNESYYDLSQFDEVYDQRQNGSENYRVNVNKVVLVWTPPGSLLTAAMLLSDYSDLENFFSPSKPQEPEDLVTKPETTKTPDASTTTTEATANASMQESSSNR